MIDGKKVTVYETVNKEIQKDSPARLHVRRQMLKYFYPVVEKLLKVLDKKEIQKQFLWQIKCLMKLPLSLKEETVVILE